MSNARQQILARVREALSVPTDAHVRGTSTLPIVDAPGEPPFREWLPPVEDSYESRKAVFAQWSEKLKTEFIAVADYSAATHALQELSKQSEWQKAGFHTSGKIEELVRSIGLPLVCTDQKYSTSELESCDVGISGCDALIAQTGSVLVTTHSAGGRALSVLPPHHVVIATRQQLLPDLVAGFELLRSKHADNWPSFMSLITGPSRTGDIERILVLGAHGPKRLTVILVEE